MAQSEATKWNQVLSLCHTHLLQPMAVWEKVVKVATDDLVAGGTGKQRCQQQKVRKGSNQQV